VRPRLVRSLVAVAAVIGLATPASAAVDLAIKRAIVEVVLENLGVTASDDFIMSIVDELDESALNVDLVAAVSKALDGGDDPRSLIEDRTDADGDGIPDEGAADGTRDDSEDESDSDESTEDESDSESNTGTSDDDDEETEDDSDEPEDESDSDDEEESEDEDESEDDD